MANICLIEWLNETNMESIIIDCRIVNSLRMIKPSSDVFTLNHTAASFQACVMRYCVYWFGLVVFFAISSFYCVFGIVAVVVVVVVFFISAECSVINVRFRLLRWLIFPFITLHFIVCAKRWNHKWVPHTHIHIHTCMCTCTFHNLKKLYSKHKKYGFFPRLFNEWKICSIFTEKICWIFAFRQWNQQARYTLFNADKRRIVNEMKRNQKYGIAYRVNKRKY